MRFFVGAILAALLAIATVALATRNIPRPEDRDEQR
ncbi:hypothetical protein BX285_1956 [Streptomyces sp. 1114.5]|nr:hypothetical protein BX285_1956 [Streptomyces sp. 1114.5]